MHRESQMIGADLDCFLGKQLLNGMVTPPPDLLVVGGLPVYPVGPIPCSMIRYDTRSLLL
jgi:hypothetical protein